MKKIHGFDVSEDFQGESVRDVLRERMLNRPEKDPFKEIAEAADKLADAEEGFDIYDLLGILVLDVADMENAKSASQFKKQKIDCRNTLKILRRKFNNLTYKNFSKK